ncbi:11209_t:CDS:1 [Acaulospora colombiana]|uniref:11209_t:CDS:1 n=1 Tax=Acaulospora colombiana TaxID=27376 RepID=A0ACA9MZW5_9GLOM|nr:11209_t:CDS:1 [Acaulospora colombiana]
MGASAWVDRDNEDSTRSVGFVPLFSPYLVIDCTFPIWQAKQQATDKHSLF